MENPLEIVFLGGLIQDQLGLQAAQPDDISLSVLVIEARASQRCLQQDLCSVVNLLELVVLGVARLNHRLLDDFFQIGLLLWLLAHEVVPEIFAAWYRVPEVA